MGNKVNKTHLEGAKKTGCLNLSDSNLRELPPQLIKMAGNLRNLDLSSNKLKLPDDLSPFSSLKILNLSNCQLKNIPNSIFQISKLENLLLDNNDIERLPESFLSLKCLKNLSIKNNKLAHFPKELLSLDNLINVNISENQITSLPPESNLLQCVELNLNKNQLTSIPQSLALCSKLKILRLDDNCLNLDGLPEQLFTNSNISLITTDGNLFLNKDLQSLPGYDQSVTLIANENMKNEPFLPKNM